MGEPIVKTKYGAVRGRYVGENPPVELARRVHQTWITFATTGDPGWIPYSTPQRAVMRINTTWDILSDPRPSERQAWDGAR